MVLLHDFRTTAVCFFNHIVSLSNAFVIKGSKTVGVGYQVQKNIEGVML